MGLPLVVSEYRERKILKRFKVTPVNPVKLLVVEFTIYVIYCVVSMLTLFLFAMLFWKIKIHGSLLLFLGSWLLTMVSTLSMLLYDRARISQKNHWLNEDGYVYFVFPITEISLKWGKCCTSVKAAMKELDEYGLLIRSSGGFSKPNHLYMRIPCIELISEPDVKQTDENKTSIGMKSCPSFSRKTASSMVGIVPPSKVKEKYNFSNKIRVNYEYEEGDSL